MTILEYIELLRGQDFAYNRSNPNMPSGYRGPALLNIHIFTRGDCWRFALLIKAMFPEAIAKLCWRANKSCGHIVIEYEGKHYDITGEISIDEWNVTNPNMSLEELRNFDSYYLFQATKFLDDLYYTLPERNAIRKVSVSSSLDALMLTDEWQKKLQKENNQNEKYFTELLNKNGAYADKIT